ncbi:hypothetical protein PVK06_042355 [Gossypium arboreum]|uniref:Homeobox protein HAT3.1-like n=1 Tax=Gossypium arboreum TaxID=29729 RepID=A0ABR0MME8_GOSAR|nr:hypothetical protein PVK06_042355 [Gossypium arboreum]
MIKVEHMGVSPSQAKTKKGNHVFPEENTSEQGHEIGSEYLLTELFENNNQCGHAITRNHSTEIATGVSCSSIHKSSSEYVANGSCPQPLRLLPKGVSEHNHTDQSFCAQETVPGKTHERHSGYVHKETSEKKHQPGSEIVKIKLEESRSWVCGLPAKHSKPFSKGLSKNAITEGLGLSPAGSKKDNIRREPSKPPEQGQQLELESLPNSKEQSTTAISTNVFNQALQLNPEDTNKSNCDKLLQSPSQGAHNVIQSGKIEDMAKNSCAEQRETTSKNFSQSKDGKTLKTIKKKYMLRSSTNNDRTLPSNSQEKSKPGQLSNNLVDVASSEQGQRRKKKRREKREVVDEYSRIRGHLRYLLNRISYERSLIAVYSAEGWKGQSLEKLKPEKELQRATSEILRRKLKIKDLFKRIDSLCAEGRLPESLFDSEGQIDSEDIFCAKCGSKDLSPNNDIILCDGACDRGFHQYCLQPPLLKEDIPPDDEGWLCPGCDCKVDCIQLLNEFQGTSFSLTDNWEKVFPEALVSEDGENQDPNFRLRSDDSNDNDYNPDGSETGEKGEGDESSSDESDFTFTFEEWEVPANVDPNLGEFPSDDAVGDDDDYDPNGSNHDTETSRESSSSDFRFDSEDLGYMLEDDIASQKDEDPMSNSASTVSKRRKSKCGGKESLKDELLSILESTSEQDGAAVSKKRNNERLDYKRLYDETYGNIPSSSSDDEDWNDATTSRKRMKCTIRATPTLSNGNACASRSEETNFNDTDLSLAEEGGVTVSGSSGKKSGSTYRRLGEAVKQRLNESFKENQYPDRSTKESLAKELDITFHQVSKWFDNARWSFNNSSSIHESAIEKVSENEIPSALETKN